MVAAQAVAQAYLVQHDRGAFHRGVDGAQQRRRRSRFDHGQCGAFEVGSCAEYGVVKVGVDVAQEDLVGQGAMGFADLDADHQAAVVRKAKDSPHDRRALLDANPLLA